MENLEKYKSLCDRFHKAIAWQNSRHIQNKTVPRETIERFINEVADPLQQEQQRLLDKGIDPELLVELFGKLIIL